MMEKTPLNLVIMEPKELLEISKSKASKLIDMILDANPDFYMKDDVIKILKDTYSQGYKQAMVDSIKMAQGKQL